MTDMQLCDYLKDWLTLDSMPAEVTRTITAISGNTYELSSSAGGATDDWVGGILEVTSGTANRARQVITGSANNAITVAGPFNSSKKPEVGDTVRLWGGPLAEAQIYTFEPDSVQAAVDRGKLYFVVINCTGGKVTQRGLGGRGTKGADNNFTHYDMEIAAETLDVTGVATVADAYRIAVELPTLKEQILTLTHWFRLQTQNNLFGEGPIEFVYSSYQRTGSPLRLRAAEIEFEVITT